MSALLSINSIAAQVASDARGSDVVRPWCVRLRPADIDSRLLKHALSTITSPTFFEVIAIYRDYDFRGVESPDYLTIPPVRSMSQADSAMEALYRCAQFRALREIHKVRDFRLVLCWGGEGEYLVRVLEEGVAAAKAEGVFDFFS